LLAFRGDELAMRIKTIEYGAHFSEPENQRSRFFKASPCRRGCQGPALGAHPPPWRPPAVQPAPARLGSGP
jgi:hypothetical protein